MARLARGSILPRDLPCQLTFPVKVDLKIEGAVLRIRGGRIEGIAAGTVTVQGTIRYEEFVLLERKAHPIPIAGKLSFEAERTSEPAHEAILVS